MLSRLGPPVHTWCAYQKFAERAGPDEVSGHKHIMLSPELLRDNPTPMMKAVVMLKNLVDCNNALIYLR